MRSDDAMRNESSESSAIIIGGNTVVAPRLRNLYWQAAIVRDKDGRRVRRFGGRG